MADNPKQPYGDVSYADPGYQKDGRKRYPVDTAEHVKAAWSYINQADNASQYSSEQLAHIKTKIKAAAEKFEIEIAPDDAKSARPPRDSLIRGVYPLEVRAQGGSEMPVLCGHFAVHNQWTEINSAWEGRFMESVVPGAGAKTMQENRANVRVLFNHGKDTSMGDKIMGPIRELREEDVGAYYEVPLYRGIPELIMEGLRDGQYGASFRFSVMKEAWNDRAEPSDWNPDGLPERKIQEYRLVEFGPVTFAAYKGASAGIRSLTDDFIIRQLVGDPERLQSLLGQHVPTALSRPGAEPAHSAVREPQQSPHWPQISREEFLGKSRSRLTPFDP